MNELPPGDQASDFQPSPDPDQLVSAQSMAKFSLWSPFLGILVFVLAAMALRSIIQDPVTRLVGTVAAGCLGWFGGLVCGFSAIHKTTIVGKQGVFVRAVIGTSLDAILICVTVLGAFAFVAKYNRDTKLLESQHLTQSRLTREDAVAVAYVKKDFGEQVSKLQKAYNSALAAMTNPPILSMALVTNKGELETRKEKLRKFIEANAALRDLWRNPSEYFGRVLSSHNENPQLADDFLSAFNKKAQATLVPMRDCDERNASAMLAVLGFLEDHWGEWYDQPAANKIIFKKANLVDPYNRLMSEVKRESAEYLRLQREAQEVLRQRPQETP